MAYLICSLNADNLPNSLYRIAEDDNYLNNLNMNKINYKIINISNNDFNAIKLNNKTFIKYNGDEVFYENINNYFTKTTLASYIEQQKKVIKDFLDNNKSHINFDQWNSYYNQLSNLNLENISFPLEKSLEQYFIDNGQTSLNTLQLP